MVNLKLIVPAAFGVLALIAAGLGWLAVHYRDAYRAERVVTDAYKIKEARDRIELSRRAVEQREIKKEVKNAKFVLEATGDWSAACAPDHIFDRLCVLTRVDRSSCGPLSSGGNSGNPCLTNRAILDWAIDTVEALKTCKADKAAICGN